MATLGLLVATLAAVAAPEVAELVEAEGRERVLVEDGLEDRTVVLVANKTDLVKSRAIKPLEGKQVAIHYNIKYIETSPGKPL